MRTILLLASVLVGIVIACTPLIVHHRLGAELTAARIAVPVLTGLVIVVGSLAGLAGRSDKRRG